MLWFWVGVTVVLVVVLWIVSAHTMKKMNDTETPASNPDHF